MSGSDVEEHNSGITFHQEVDALGRGLFIDGLRYNEECGKLTNVKSFAEFQHVRSAIDQVLSEYEASIEKAHSSLDSMASRYGLRTNDKTVVAARDHLDGIHLQDLKSSVATWSTVNNVLSNDQSVDSATLDPLKRWLDKISRK